MTQRTFTVNESVKESQTPFLVQLAGKFVSSVRIILDNKTVNAKSIMGVIALGGVDGKNITVTAEGADEVQAVNEIAEFLR